MPNLNSGILSALPLVLPPPAAQRGIAEVLGALDDKIEVNRRIIAVANDLLEAIYRSEAPEAASHQASELLEPVLGGTPSRDVPEYWDGDIPWATAKDVAASTEGVLVETAERITDQGLDRSPAKLVPRGTTLITARGTVGKLGRTDLPATSFNQTCYALTPKTCIDPLILYLSMKEAVARIDALTHGTVFSTITKQTFSAVQLRVPPEATWDKVGRQLQPVDRIVCHALRENLRLAALRNALLPKIVSGVLQAADDESVSGGV
jgi:type I restriction enzyme S subunit